MHVVVGGAGEVGFGVAKALVEEGHEVVIIDPVQDRIERVQDLGVTAIQGNVADRARLIEAGIEQSDLFIACSGDDEVNMVAAALAKTFGKHPRTLCRINAKDYIDGPYTHQYAAMGIDVAVCPELVAATRIARQLAQPTLVPAEAFGDGKVVIAEGVVADGAFLVGKRVNEVEPPPGFNLVAIYREDDVVIPRGSTVFEARDRLLMALASLDVLKDVEPYIGSAATARPDEPPKPIKRVMVAGATRVGLHLARLLEADRDVVLVEKDPAKCELASSQLNRALVVHGDATDRHLLIQENVDTFDAFIGADKTEEYNTLAALIAKQLGVPRTLVIVNQPELKPLVERLGIDLAVAPRLSTVGALLKAIHTTAEQLTVLHQGEAQIIEIKVGPQSPVAGKQIKRAGLPDTAVIGAIVRGDRFLVPRGEHTLDPGDTLVVFTLMDAVKPLEKLF